VAKNERTHNRLRQKLPGMSAKQGVMAPAVQTKLTIGTTLRALAINSDGLYHGTPHVGRMRPAMGNYRPIYQNGALYTATRENRHRPSHNLRQGGMEVPRTSDGHRVGSRFTF